MNGFVDECRKEWSRLGVPDAVSSEMAADLAADLAEAEADGVSTEEVLGNAVFDARSFAASWATAHGVVSDAPGSRRDGARPVGPWPCGAASCRSSPGPPGSSSSPVVGGRLSPRSSGVLPACGSPETSDLPVSGSDPTRPAARSSSITAASRRSG